MKPWAMSLHACRGAAAQLTVAERGTPLTILRRAAPKVASLRFGGPGSAGVEIEDLLALRWDGDQLWSDGDEFPRFEAPA